ncbi:MAG TPA: L-lactate permease [Firmicutes bacterium]|jgi:lactate permease|nr:L-lactate permease [Candidatus Fermentithermobacillaceae bacterium]
MVRWLLASSPLFVLLFTLLKLKWKAKDAGATALIVALLIGGIAFGGQIPLLAIACAKGMSLTLFVVLIIWTSGFMYQMVSQTGSVPVISKWMTTLSNDRLMLGLLVGWCLTGVIQAVAGYGVPVAVCAPLMIAAGFEPLTAAVASLVGHAWAISFGSMASSFYTLTLSTKIPPEITGHWVGLTFIVPTILTGMAVAHILEGWEGVRKGFAKVVIVGAAMSSVQWFVAKMGSAQVAALLGSLAGVGLVAFMSPRERKAETPAGAAPHVAQGLGSATSIHLALAPYYALLIITLISQIGPVKAFFKPYRLGVNYPAMTTTQGYEVAAEKAYAAIGLFSHPAPLITLASVIGLFVYIRKGLLGGDKVRLAWKATVKQSWPTTLGVLTMVMMALVMNDTGMTSEMASGVARVAGPLFPVVSPFIGVLGCFMTGSNTNANILFGSFQMETAKTLGLSATLIAGSQTAGASLASSIAPAKVLLGSSTSGLSGREDEVLKKCLPYCMFIVLMLGIQTLIATWTLTVTP